jgi:hypothetical protein
LTATINVFDGGVQQPSMDLRVVSTPRGRREIVDGGGGPSQRPGHHVYLLCPPSPLPLSSVH